MTPRQRVLAAAHRQQPDRVPVAPMMREFAMKQSGLTFADCYANPDAYVEAQLRCREASGTDAVWDLFGIAALEEAAGSVLTTPEHEPPAVTAPALPERDLRRLRRFDPVGDGRMPQLLDIVRKLRQAAVPDLPVFAWVSAPFHSACMLRGLESLFLDLHDDPAFVEALTHLWVEPCARFALALAEAGADVIVIGNATASANMISRAAYARFVHPSDRALIAILKGAGVTTMMHICGGLNDRADLVFAEGMDILSFERLDVPRCKAAYGREVCFLGYVGSTTTLLRGTPPQAEQESLACIREAGTSGGLSSAPTAWSRGTRRSRTCAPWRAPPNAWGDTPRDRGPCMPHFPKMM